MAFKVCHKAFKFFEKFETLFPNINLIDVEQQLSKIIRKSLNMDTSELQYKCYYIENKKLKNDKINYIITKECHDAIV